MCFSAFSADSAVSKSSAQRDYDFVDLLSKNRNVHRGQFPIQTQMHYTVNSCEYAASEYASQVRMKIRPQLFQGLFDE